MIKNICKKILIIVLLMTVFSIIILNNNRCFALSDVTNSTWWSDWEPTAEYDSDVLDKTGVILGAVRVVGIVISVVTLVVIGIKIMLGSVEEKANYKQTLMPWIIGATMVFAITVIPTTIYDMTKGALPNSGSQNNSQYTEYHQYYIAGYDDAMKYYKKNGKIPDGEQQQKAKKIHADYGSGYMAAIDKLLEYGEKVKVNYLRGVGRFLCKL